MRQGETRVTKHAKNPLGARRQCTASSGKTGRCPRESTQRYAQRWHTENGHKIVWMDRCDDHPMSNHAGVEPIADAGECSRCGARPPIAALQRIAMRRRRLAFPLVHVDNCTATCGAAQLIKKDRSSRHELFNVDNRKSLRVAKMDRSRSVDKAQLSTFDAHQLEDQRMTLFTSWGYDVQNMPERSKFSRRPDRKKNDPGEVSVYWFTVCRGRMDSDDRLCVQISVTRLEVDAEILHNGGLPTIASIQLLLQAARKVARIKATMSFKEHDAKMKRVAERQRLIDER